MPKGAYRHTPEVVADIATRRVAGASYRAIAAAVGVRDASVRRASTPATDTAAAAGGEGKLDDEHATGEASEAAETIGQANPAVAGLVMLPGPADRTRERAAARNHGPGRHRQGHELLAAMAARHVSRLDATSPDLRLCSTSTGTSRLPRRPQGRQAPPLPAAATSTPATVR
jgi:hypothetical protein